MNLQGFLGFLGRNAVLIVSTLMAVACIAMVLFGKGVTSKKSRFFLFLPLAIASIGGFCFDYSLNTELSWLYTTGTTLLVAGFAVVMIYAFVWFTPKAIRVFMTPKI